MEKVGSLELLERSGSYRRVQGALRCFRVTLYPHACAALGTEQGGLGGGLGGSLGHHSTQRNKTALAREIFELWPEGSSSLTRDGTQAPCIESSKY